MPLNVGDRHRAGREPLRPSETSGRRADGQRLLHRLDLRRELGSGNHRAGAGAIVMPSDAPFSNLVPRQSHAGWFCGGRITGAWRGPHRRGHVHDARRKDGQLGLPNHYRSVEYSSTSRRYRSARNARNPGFRYKQVQPTGSYPRVYATETSASCVRFKRSRKRSPTKTDHRVPHPVPWTHICAMPPGVAHTPRAPRSACDTQASRDARSGCTAPRSRPRRRGRPRGSERFGRGSLAP